MTATAQKGEMGRTFALAVRCAATLTAVLAIVCFVGWMAGITSLADIASVLSGVFLGSLLMGLSRPDKLKAPRRG